MIVRFREPKQMAYRFGPFGYDRVSRGLLHGGVDIALTHKSRELLHPGARWDLRRSPRSGPA